ncbi:hypothetical protein [Cellulomonas xiejunii]|uniref:Uncharacterized protein n=1 Tax=Cellulomonas xiejunii TaxID=2968083 RepID=A0ABY5KTI5_9CELL|nr:hypothetical protein [Cellulomonas xiejunii]MCC2322747.1 hypothetical protein [Cellulomonas xiejunii]UUI72776.1 hypothetical protein NP048_04825 [Cellulomonas xiejunii]
MPEHVIDHDLGVLWEPNAPEAVIVSQDAVLTLALRAHPDDIDQRTVVLRWSGVVWWCAGAPNDEAVASHRLYQKGLDRVLWSGRVERSELVESLAPGSPRASGSTHDVVLLKEETVEVVACAVEVLRADGTPRDAARIALS